MTKPDALRHWPNSAPGSPLSGDFTLCGTRKDASIVVTNRPHKISCPRCREIKAGHAAAARASVAHLIGL